MFPSKMNILALIPQSLHTKVLDATVDVIMRWGGDVLDEEMLRKVRGLPSDGAFRLAFEEGLQRAADRFVLEYLDEDEDLVEVITEDEHFFKNKEVQEALLALFSDPVRYLATQDEQIMVAQSFDTLFPRRHNRKRVRRAVSFFLQCLVTEVWKLDLLHDINDIIQISAVLPSQSVSISDSKPSAPYHNLPRPDYERFVGRKKEQAELHQLLSPQSRHFVITIDGIGGIGKSALALEVAHHYRQGYASLSQQERFSALIWATAKQSILTSQGIQRYRHSLRALDDIYSTIASALQREDITRARREEQEQIVAQALCQQRTLLIIDNLETVDDTRIMSFIRNVPRPTKVIVTTRHRLNIAYPMRLVGMSQEEALELISNEANLKNITLTTPQAIRFVKRTGGVPLAIVWSIAQMSIKNDVKAILSRLSHPSSDIAQFCFQGAIELIRHSPAHHLLMALSLFATDASRDALGYVTNLPILDRDEGLEELERLSLVNKEADRFALLPLTKSYSEHELGKDGKLEESFRERWVGYFLEFLREEKSREYESLDIVNPEIPNILSVIDWCWIQNQKNYVIKLVLKISFYLWITGKWEIWENLLQKGLDATYIYPSELPKARILKNIAELKKFHEETNTAIDYTLQAIDIFRRYNNNDGLADSQCLLSVIYFQENNIKEARDALNQALLLATRTNKRLISRIKRYLAVIYLAEGNLDLAELTLHEAKELREKEAQFSSGLSHILISLGSISLLKHNHKQARQSFDKSLQMANQMGSQRHFCETKQRVAELELALGNSEKAIELAHEALEGFTKLGMKREIRQTDALLAQIAAQSQTA